jgi:membrane protein DedA with SNARE-associated domain
MLALAALINVSSNLGYLLPAIIGLESMGIPSPGETALVAAAVLASQGRLNIVLVIVIGVASAIIGDNIGYLIGRRLGRDVLSAPGPGQQHRIKALDAGDRFYDKHGSKAVFFGRWVALVRVAAAWLAGINHMPFRRFFFWNALGALTWGITVGVLGYVAGHAIVNVISEVGVIAAIVLAVAAVVGFGYVRVRKRRRELDAAGAESAGVEPGAAEPAGVEPGAAEPAGTESPGAKTTEVDPAGAD